MSDTILTLTALQTLFQSLTMTMLGLDPATWNAYQAALTGLKTVAVSPINPGAGYVVGNVLTVVQPGASGGTFIVDTVDGAGAVLAGHIGAGGTGYAVANGLSTTGGAGSGCKLNVTAINSWTQAIPSNPYAKVRIAYPTTGAPAWSITDDVVSIQCQEVDDPYNRQHDVVVSTVGTVATVKRGRTRVNGVTWVFRGPNAYDNAQLVKDSVFYDAHKLTLAQSNVYLIPDDPTPRRIPEPFQGQWWERTDLTMRFNELVVRNPTAGTIGTVPLVISDKSGTIVETDISETP